MKSNFLYNMSRMATKICTNLSDLIKLRINFLSIQTSRISIINMIKSSFHSDLKFGWKKQFCFYKVN